MSEEERCRYAVGELGLAGAHAGAWTGLVRVHRELTRRFEAGLEARHGLSLSALELLARLAEAEDRRLTLSPLAAEIGLSLSRVSRIVDTLEARGLVQRQTCPGDTRARHAWLTDAGLALVQEAQAAHREDVQQAFFDRLDEAELEVLTGVFAKL